MTIPAKAASCQGILICCPAFAAEIRSKRPPEPYHGKGVKYEGEHIRRKAGKTGK